MSKKAKATKATDADKPALVPQLRFPEFRNSAGWQNKLLSDCLFESKTRNRDLIYTPNDVISVSGEFGCVNQIEHMGRSYAGVSVKEYHVLETGDIVYTKSPLKKNPYGIIKENKGRPGIVSTLYAVYRPKDGCLPAFIDNFFSRDDALNAYLQPIVRKGAKNDMKVNNHDVLGGRVYVPKFAEQRKIADFLSNLDGVIKVESQKVEALRAHKKGLMQLLFPAEGQTLPQLRFPEFSTFGDWRVKRLGECGQTISGLSGKSGEDFGNGKPFVTYKQVFDSALIDLTRCGYVGISENEHQNILERGDVLITGSSETPAEVGYASVILNSPAEPIYLNSFCFAFRPQCPFEFMPAFSRYLFHSPLYREKVTLLAQGSTRYNLSKRAFLDLNLPIPQQAEQQKIADCLSSLDELIAAQAGKVQALKAHKKGLMQQLFPSPVDEAGSKMELAEIAKQLKDAPEKIILIYAFNATGKTRLSVEYKEATRATPEGDSEKGKQTGVYYNAYSEDLFVWDNDLENGEENMRLKVIESSLNNFHSNLDEPTLRKKLVPYKFNFDFEFNSYPDNGEESRVTGKKGSERGIESISFFKSDDKDRNIKISRGEERVFVWCFFLALFDVEAWADQQAGHIFIDDPVSSLDDHNIFITASTIYDLIEKHYQNRKIIITTHHIGLFSILADWLMKGEKAGRYKSKTKLSLLSSKSGELTLEKPDSDVFLYHLQLMRVLDKAQRENELRTYHFALLRQVLENIASFLGVARFAYVLEQIGVSDKDEVARIVNALSHQNVYHYQTDIMKLETEKLFRDVFLRVSNRYNFVLHGDAA